MDLSEHFRAVEALPDYWHVMRSMFNLTEAEYEKSFARLVKQLKKVSRIELIISAVHFPRRGGFEALGKALGRGDYPRLKMLQITDNVIDLEGVEEMGSAVKMGNLSNLRVIILTNCGINSAGAEILAEAMQFGKMARLETLHIDGNSIGDKGVMALATLLSSGSLPALRSLAVSFEGEHDLHSRVTKQISKDAVEAMGKAMQSDQMSRLNVLTMRHIAQKGLLASVMEVMKSGTVFKLRSFTLADSDVGEAEGKVLASALHSPNFSSSLLSLSLGENVWVGDDGLAVKALMEGFRSPYLSGLEVLKMETSGAKKHQSIEDEALSKIAELLEVGYLPRLKMLHARYISTYHVARMSPPAVIRAYQNNPFLVAEVLMDWPSESTKGTADRLRRYNQKLVKRLKWLRIEPQVRKTHLKVLLCGHSKVGRSTLRRALCRSQWEALTTAREQEWRTTYEVSQVVQKKLVIRLWDTDFPQILLADAAPTVFIVVCSANYCQTAKENKSQAKQELLHWLNHIASTSLEGTQEAKRHVMVVLNSFEGAHSCHSEPDWTTFITLYSDIYEDSLNICPTPFILSALSRRDVRQFKKQLVDFARFRTWKVKNQSLMQQSSAFESEADYSSEHRGAS